MGESKELVFLLRSNMKEQNALTPLVPASCSPLVWANLPGTTPIKWKFIQLKLSPAVCHTLSWALREHQ